MKEEIPAQENIEPFDLESVYDAEISPLMSQIIEICKRHNMPMVATFCYAKGRNPQDLSELDYCTTTIPRGEWSPPEIREAVHIIRNGASTRPKMLAMTITNT